MITTLGNAVRNCSRTPVVSGAPPLPIENSIDRSYDDGSAISRSANGRAMASPMVDNVLVLARDANDSTSCASKRGREYMTKAPPPMMALPITH